MRQTDSFNSASLKQAQRVNRSVLNVVVLVLAGALSACTLVPGTEPMQVYQLPEANVVASSAPVLEQSLRISTPQANKTLSGTRVLVVPRAQQISAYGDARWSDNAPIMLRDYLITAFRQSGQLSAVVDEHSRVRADLELVSDLRAFQSEYQNGQPEAVIQLEAQLVNSRTQTIIASQRFEVRSASDSTNVRDVIRAFGQASEELSTQLLDWSHRHASNK